MSVSSIVAGEAYVRILPGSMRLLYREPSPVRHEIDSLSSQIAACCFRIETDCFFRSIKKRSNDKLMIQLFFKAYNLTAHVLLFWERRIQNTKIDFLVIPFRIKENRQPHNIP